MTGKKDHIMPSYRVESDLAREYYAALEHFGISRTAFARACMAAIVRQHRAGESLAFPIRFEVSGSE